MTTSDDDRIAYLADETAGSLTEEDRAELTATRAMLQHASTWIDPDPGLEERVVAAVAGAAQTKPAEGSAESAERSPQRAARARRRPRVWSWLWLSRPGRGLIALTAVAAAAIIVAISVQSSSPAAQQFAMVVSGTPLAPDARGSASLTKTASGWRIELTATGLQHLENGRYYEAWLKNQAGVLVPVGTFNDARRVTLWSGVPVTQFRALTVTEQRANGNPASSGQRVLGGTVRPAG